MQRGIILILLFYSASAWCTAESPHINLNVASINKCQNFIPSLNKSKLNNMVKSSAHWSDAIKHKIQPNDLSSVKFYVRHLNNYGLRNYLKSYSSIGILSPYDVLVKKYANQYNFDWTLITAQMYQESRFNPRARSFAGAMGLMQIMPQTGKQLGIVDFENPDSAIHGGIRYMAWLEKRFESNLPIEEKQWFMLAAYNAGIGHVHDARSLARKLGLRSDRWFGNVEKAMLLLANPKYSTSARHGFVRGKEPVKYVRAIRRYYRQYNKLPSHPS